MPIFQATIPIFNVGFSVMHINRPKESFFSESVVDNRLQPRFTVFLNGSFKINDQWIVNPNVYVSKMEQPGKQLQVSMHITT